MKIDRKIDQIDQINQIDRIDQIDRKIERKKEK